MTLLSLWITTVAVCVVGSIIPLVNTEVYLITVSALAPAEFVAPLVVAATIGQMLGKVVMYYAGRGVMHVRNTKVREKAVACLGVGVLGSAVRHLRAGLRRGARVRWPLSVTPGVLPVPYLDRSDSSL